MLILRCDAIGCGKETGGVFLPSGRIVANDRTFWLLLGTDFRVACCMEHALGLNASPRDIEQRSGGTDADA